MKALIIYQDPASAARVNLAMQRAGQNADASVQWNIRLWRVDLLKFPPSAEEALADAVDTHLIVFAGGIKQSLPFWLRHWLEYWAQRRQIKNAALAVSSDGIADALSISAAQELLDFATCHGLDFIFDDSATVALPSSEDRSAFSEGRLQDCELSLSPIPPPTLDTKLRNDHRGWGITE